MRLTEALEHMPDSQRRAILLREWQGLSYHEIADELELSQSAVETLIFRARRTLASNLEAEPKRPSRLSRMRKAVDVGTLLAALKGLFEGGAAVKVAAVAVAASGTAVVATTPPSPLSKPAQEHAAVTSVAPAATAPVVFERTRPQVSAVNSNAARPSDRSAPPTGPAAVGDVTAATQAPESTRAADRAHPTRRLASNGSKATPPGQAKQREPRPQARSNAGNDKNKARSPTVHRRQPAPVQSAAPTPEQPVASAEPETAESDDPGSKGPKK